MSMTSATDLQSLSSLLAGIEINNVFNESQLPARTTGRPPFHSSLSLPPDSFYHADLTGVSAGDTTFLPMRLPAPKLAARRTQSIGEPTTLYPGVGQDVQGTSKQASTAVSARYKTELCRPFEENGTCRYGSKCQFAHGKAELRSVVRHPKYKTDLCRTFHTTGLCPYGPRCHFIHNDDERPSSESSSEQVRQQLAAVQEIGRRSTSVQHCLEDSRPRLQRHYSEYRPRDEPRQRGVAVLGSARTGPAVDLQRRASSVADAVIRYQHQLQTVLESDQYSGLSVNAAAGSLGSVTDSSSASSVTDSPSPSPTAGLILPAVEDPVTPTLRQPPTVPAGWPGEDDRARAALLAELVARLAPQDVAALIRALQLPANTPTSSGSVAARELDGSDVDATASQWPPSDTWTQNHHHQYQRRYQQQQQQHGPTTSNVC